MTKLIYDGNNKIVGTEVATSTGKLVYSADNRFVGSTGHGQTRDKNGKLVSPNTENTGLLYKK